MTEKKVWEETWTFDESEDGSAQVLNPGGARLALFHEHAPCRYQTITAKELEFRRKDEHRGRLAAQAPAMARMLLRLVSSDEFAKDRPEGTLERDALNVLHDAGVLP